MRFNKKELTKGWSIATLIISPSIRILLCNDFFHENECISLIVCKIAKMGGKPLLYDVTLTLLSIYINMLSIYISISYQYISEFWIAFKNMNGSISKSHYFVNLEKIVENSSWNGSILKDHYFLNLGKIVKKSSWEGLFIHPLL